MDTSVLEYTAEDLVAHKLQRAGILVAKPRFDQEGADLLGLVQVRDGARFCRIQCKGRTVGPKSRSEVVVPSSYVTAGFVLFLFLETGDVEVTNLYCFFSADIKTNWARRGNSLVLGLKGSLFAEDLKAFVATQERVNLVKAVIQSSDVAEEIIHISPVGMAVERDEALPLASLQSRTVGIAEERDEALPLRRAEPPN